MSENHQAQDVMEQVETTPANTASEEPSESVADVPTASSVTADCDDATDDTTSADVQEDTTVTDTATSSSSVLQDGGAADRKSPKVALGRSALAISAVAIALAGLGFAVGRVLPTIVGGTEASTTSTEITASTGSAQASDRKLATKASSSQVRFQSSDELADYIWKRSEARMRAEDSKMTTAQKAIVKSAKETGPSGASMCLSWVNDVFERSGWEFERLWAASEACETWCHSTDMDDLEPGMIVAVESTETSPMAGHIGIYIGHGMIRDNETWGGEGIVMTRPVDEWLEMFGKVATPKWGWAGDYDLTDPKTRPRVIEKDVEEERIPESEE